MQNNEKNFVSATVVGPRKREIGLVRRVDQSRSDRRVADILSKEILKIKTKYSHFDLQYEEDKKLCKRPYLLEKKNRKYMWLFSFVLNKHLLLVT